jgi:hypothetical protein
MVLLVPSCIAGRCTGDGQHVTLPADAGCQCCHQEGCDLRRIIVCGMMNKARQLASGQHMLSDVRPVGWNLVSGDFDKDCMI